MKFSLIALLLISLTAEAQEQSDCDQGLLDRIEENENAYAANLAAKEEEIAGLLEQLAECQAPVDASSDETTPANDVTSVTSSGSSTWIPRVGDSWNYNLDAPVDTDVNVDIIFIDMGELFTAGRVL